MTAAATAATAAPAALVALAAALHPWTLADLARLLRLGADGHDVALKVDRRNGSRCLWFHAGWVAVLDRVHLSPDTADPLVEAGLLPRHELHGESAFVTAAVARDLADALDPVEVAS